MEKLSAGRPVSTFLALAAQSVTLRRRGGPGRRSGAVWAILALASSLFAAVPQAQIPNGDFAAGLKGWTTEGDVTVQDNALVVKRDAATLPATKAASGRFPLGAGVWELSGAVEHELHSPDVSFNVSVALRFFDAAGKEIKKRRLLALPGNSPWKQFRERVQVPAGAETAIVEVEYNKTHGVFRIKDLALAYAGKAIPMEGGDRRTIFRSNRVGQLFYPGDAVRLEMEIETPAELSASQLEVSWQVTDFWRAPVAPAAKAVLEPAGKSARGWLRYRTVLDASSLPVRVGPYYEIQTVADLGAATPARDTASFAILPEPRTASLDPMKVPFGAHTWNATVYDYFPLAARLGIRRCLVFWSWPEKPPYEPNYDSGHPHESRIEWPKRFGIAPYGVLYPIMGIEHRDGPEYSDEALREGLKKSIGKYKGDGLWGFQIGNEPPHWNPEMVKRDVEVYRIAYETIKAADPEFVVIGSAIGPNETFFKAGFQPYQDVYNVHAYSDLGELRQAMRKYHELFQKYGGRKPIWSTEIGSKSQGLPRDVIARDIIRKAVCFFADGGEFFTWFAVGGMPDPDGERAGGYSDSMDLFAGKFNMHLPRLDAVVYYHLINTLGAKKFRAERRYPGGAQAFLFGDEQGNALMVLWNAERAQERMIPLPGVREAALTSMAGNTRQLDAGGEGITLRVGADPVFLEFRSAGASLPDALPEAALTAEALPEALTQGATVELRFRAPPDKALNLSGPATWSVTSAGAENGVAAWKVNVPEDTAARMAAFRLTDETMTGQGNTELQFVLPVKSRIEADIMPLAGANEGEGAAKLIVANHSEKTQEVKWSAEILEELPIFNGTFALADARPPQAYFTDLASGSLSLQAGEKKELPLRLGGLDRQTIYQLRAGVTDGNGNVVQRTRRVGGFARAPRAAGVTVDGLPNEGAWSEAPVYRLDEERQFCAVKPEAKKWEGADDLSGTVRFLWDDEYLYVAVEVHDDVFANPGADNSLWNQDGLQFLFDPHRSAAASLGRYDYSMGVGKKGPQAWCHMTADPGAPVGLVPEIRLAMKRGGEASGNAFYEVAIPWKRLAPFVPRPGGDLGLTMVINEDDGSGRKSTIGWFGGVHLKEALFVGDVILDR